MIIGPFQALRPEYSDAIKTHYPYHVPCADYYLGNGSRTLATIDEWCEERYGPTAKASFQEWEGDGYAVIYYTLNVDRLWMRRIGVWCFRDADAAFDFKMRWG